MHDSVLDEGGELFDVFEIAYFACVSFCKAFLPLLSRERESIHTVVVFRISYHYSIPFVFDAGEGRASVMRGASAGSFGPPLFRRDIGQRGRMPGRFRVRLRFQVLDKAVEKWSPGVAQSRTRLSG